jgi:hypothetical protein
MFVYRKCADEENIMKHPVLLVCVLAAVCCHTARAGVRIVDPAGNGDYLTIAAGIAGSATGDTLRIMAGTYGEHLTLSKSLTLIGSLASGATRLSGFDSFRVLTISGPHAVRLEHLTFQDGFDADAGGAVFCNGGAQLVVHDCDFTGNYSAWDSGAIRVGGANTIATFTECEFRNNYAVQGGAAIQVQLGASLVMYDCTIRDNATETIGGGLTIWQSFAELRRCLFLHNSGYGAGAVHLEQGTAEIASSTFHDNITYDNGTITLAGDSYLNLKNTILSHDRSGFGLAVLYGECDHECNDYYGNAGGAIFGDAVHPGEIQANPQFANAAGGDFDLLATSPCLPANNDCGVLMGRSGLQDAMALVSVTDVPDDEGGYLTVAWTASSNEASPLASTVVLYEVQRFGDGWGSVAQAAPEGLPQYAVTVATPDIEIVGEIPPQSLYRVAAILDEGEPTCTEAMPGCSVDDIAPVVRLELYEPDPMLLVCWFPVTGEDIDHVELYRDVTPGFVPGAPFEILHEVCYLQDHPAFYYYVARPVDRHGNIGPWTEMLNSDPTATPELPAAVFAMEPLQPNPFNPCTLLRFGTTEPGHVKVEVHDLRGTRIAVLGDGRLEAGRHEMSWSGRDEAGLPAAAGIYVFRVTSGEGVLTRKAALIK